MLDGLSDDCDFVYGLDSDTHDESSSKNIPPLPTPTPPLLFLLIAKSIPPPLPLPNRTLLNLEQILFVQDQLCHTDNDEGLCASAK